jgi:ferrous iron transport protein A
MGKSPDYPFVVLISAPRFSIELSVSLLLTAVMHNLEVSMEMSSLSTASKRKLGGPIAFLGGSAGLGYRPEHTEAEVNAPHENSSMLATSAVEDQVWVLRIDGGQGMVRRLAKAGITVGSKLTILSRAESGSVIVEHGTNSLGIGATIAQRIVVSSAPPEATPTGKRPLGRGRQRCCGASMSSAPEGLGGLRVGQSGRILSYAQGCRAYRSKLLSMGLTPGTRFTVTRQAPLGDPIEIQVRGFKLSLRKGEAAALKVERVGSK